MAAALGVTLNEELKSRGVKGVLRFKTASYIPTWAWSKELPLYLAHHKPDLVLITLGTNEVQMRDPTIRAKTIEKLVARLEGRPCVWIAPPLWEVGDTGLLPVIRKHARPCRFMDTASVYPDMPRLGDKIHPTIVARQEWAKRVVDWLAREREPKPDAPWRLRAP
jgi:lysophospholipase L1-like esterase